MRFAACFAFAILISTSALVEAAKSPNVLLILSDDQAYTDYGFMGHKVIETPRLDRLARESVVFTRGYVPSSLCRPSLMSLITGRYPHEHKICGNDPPKGTDRATMLKHVEAAATLPKLLGKEGYLSMQSGKWWEGNYKLGGFTHGMTHGDPTRGGRHGDEGLKIGRTGLAPVFEFIDSCGERPFFVWYAPMLPHTPHNPPERLLKKYEPKVESIHVARYYAMCEWFDETCGELLDHLDKRGLAENTLVFYVTDNGWIQDPTAGKYAPKSKRSPYDGGLRTPILLRWPARLKPRRDEETLVSSLDFFPTVLAACGTRAPEGLPGLNLLDTESGKLARRDTLYGEIFEHDVGDIDRPEASLLFRWCVAGERKLIVPTKGAAELYDLAADPSETRNLAAEKPDEARELTRRLDDWWKPGRN